MPQNQNSLANVPAVILAGGLGTRLRSVVADRPKVLATVHGRPYLAYLLDQLIGFGIRQVVLCTGYKGEQIHETFGDRYRTASLHYSQESEPLGTAGALRLALPRLTEPLVLAMNGDSYCDADFSSLLQWHRDGNFTGSLLLTRVPDTSRYGRVITTDSGQVFQFEEKGANRGMGWINAGVYLLGRDLLAEIPSGAVASLERDMLPKWIQRPFGGFPAPAARFLDIGTPESYAETERFFAPLSA